MLFLCSALTARHIFAVSRGLESEEFLSFFGLFMWFCLLAEKTRNTNK